MGVFLVDRGHDGPARIGTLQTTSGDVSLPSLLLPFKRENSVFYRIGVASESPAVSVLPSLFVENGRDASLLQTTDSILLPSIVGSSSLGAQAAEFLMDYQMNTILDLVEQGVNPSNMILRIPSSFPLESFPEAILPFDKKGVTSASFIFDGQCGPNDLYAIQLRSRLPSNWLALSLGRVPPYLVPILFYLGFDLIDCAQAMEAAAQFQRLWRIDKEHISSDHSPRRCSCYACSTESDISDLSTAALYNLLAKHNTALYQDIVSESINALHHGKLRWLVESLTHAAPSVGALLRRIDSKLYSFIEEFTPTSGPKSIPLIGPESYNAPIVRRFRERLVERYRPSSFKRIVLLLPCSARKPYSDSKSHRRFIDAIESSLRNQRHLIAESILTSPLGVIPRELERVFPISSYDIPVTGTWDEEEIEIGSSALVSHLKKFKDDTVIVAHLTGGYRRIIEASEDEITQTLIYTTDGEQSVTRRESIDALREVLTELSDILDLESGSQSLVRDTVHATADFQFGLGAGDILVPSNARVKGKLYRMALSKIDSEQVCAFISETGALSLTLDGGERLSSLETYIVRFEGETLKGGSLFAVGVNEADPVIRPGDEVIIVNREDRVVGVGKSEMAGREMCELKKGRAVTIRHKTR